MYDEDYPFYDGDYITEREPEQNHKSIEEKNFDTFAIVLFVFSYIAAICGAIPLW